MQNPDNRIIHLRMTKILLYIFIAFFFYLDGPFLHNAFSQSALTKTKTSKKEEPIEINSDRMRSMDSGKKIIFSGNVVGVWGDLEIRSDIFELYTEKAKNSSRGDLTGGKTLREVIAIGNVHIKRGTKKGGVSLAGFGSFNVSNRKARLGRNPQTGEEIKIKASRTVRFRPGKSYKEML